MSVPRGQVDAAIVPRFAGLRTFARLPRVEDVETVDIGILGAPYDGATTFRAGSRFGPSAVREASLLLRPYDPVLGVSPFDTVQVADAGDAALNPVDMIEAHAAIEDAARALHEGGAAVVGLGGDHSVALPLLRAAAAAHGPLGLIQLDAHTDTWDSYFGADLTHGTMFRRAVEEGTLDPARSVQVGLRGSLYAENDLDENRELGFTAVTAQMVDRDGVDGALEAVREVAAGGPVYVTVDVDVLDPAFAPGTGTPEIGGLTPRELQRLLAGVADAHGERIVSADVVEVAPAYDVANLTAMAAANAAYHLISTLARSRAGR